VLFYFTFFTKNNTYIEKGTEYSMPKGKNLGEIIKNETPEQRESRIAKMKETRRKNDLKKFQLKETILMLEDEYFQVPAYAWIQDSEGKWKKEMMGYERLKGSRALAVRLMNEAIDPESKNVVPAFKAIAEITGEFVEEKQNMTLVVQLNNDKLDI
jgi:hypothetical protein